MVIVGSVLYSLRETAQYVSRIRYFGNDGKQHDGDIHASDSNRNCKKRRANRERELPYTETIQAGPGRAAARLPLPLLVLLLLRLLLRPRRREQSRIDTGIRYLTVISHGSRTDHAVAVSRELDTDGDDATVRRRDDVTGSRRGPERPAHLSGARSLE